ncbi:hypothetical protein DL546_004233 [Coniochaeta pulveracea]|uniref:Secreted protein n=1 Tax=Coniochaeta pulveracea TaxID=177199 RepID=A0A420Y723_9PEZI|nr:hypothetical protein DL546_004233 [Coniochaeta pulveracea]
MWWPTSLAFTLLLLYPLPVFAPFPPAPHRNGWHPDKPGMRMPWTQPPPPKKPPPYKKILPHGTKCIRPNVIGAEEQETTLMIELLDGYPACFVRLPPLLLLLCFL